MDIEKIEIDEDSEIDGIVYNLIDKLNEVIAELKYLSDKINNIRIESFYEEG